VDAPVPDPAHGYDHPPKPEGAGNSSVRSGLGFRVRRGSARRSMERVYFGSNSPLRHVRNSTPPDPAASDGRKGSRVSPRAGRKWRRIADQVRIVAGLEASESLGFWGG
jgi:hypothetical protein